MSAHEHDAAGCLDCACFAGPPNSLPCTCTCDTGDPCPCGHGEHLHDRESDTELCMVCGDSDRCVTPPGVTAARRPMTAEKKVGMGRCSRCKGLETADIGVPWERHDGTWEWVKVRPHLHHNTGRSTCKPKGYARRVTSPGGSTPIPPGGSNG